MGNKFRKYRFVFRYGIKEIEKEQETFRYPEDAFDRACALLDFTDCDEVRMFEYNELTDKWIERTDLY